MATKAKGHINNSNNTTINRWQLAGLMELKGIQRAKAALADDAGVEFSYWAMPNETPDQTEARHFSGQGRSATTHNFNLSHLKYIKRYDLVHFLHDLYDSNYLCPPLK